MIRNVLTSYLIVYAHHVSQVDRLSSLLERFRVRTRVFHTGRLCGTTRLEAVPGRGFLHVLRRGEMVMTHLDGSGHLVRTDVTEPSLLFYPRPVEHHFHNAPQDGADFACATLDFAGGDLHPLVRALPPVVVLPLYRVDGLDEALQLLFAEVDQVRCGQRLVADRLFEVVLLQLLRWILDHPDDVGITPGLLSGLADPDLAPALVAIHDDPGGRWTVQAMAAQAAMSRSAFSSRFTAVVGQPPADYLTGWRLTIAQSRLQAGDQVTSIAADLGYANASALSRVFTQRVGSSPRHWLAASGTPIPASRG